MRIAAAVACSNSAAAAPAPPPPPPPEEKKKPIKFKDAVGRKFSFPFELCATWPGMEELIKTSFPPCLMSLVLMYKMANYDLIGPMVNIILPQIWDTVIEPDWAITMHMWPIPEPQKPAPPTGPPGPPPMNPNVGPPQWRPTTPTSWCAPTTSWSQTTTTTTWELSVLLLLPRAIYVSGTWPKNCNGKAEKEDRECRRLRVDGRQKTHAIIKRSFKKVNFTTIFISCGPLNT
ncbi:hypothetical protein DID88_010074 [Monilinia fructigena]|uniref:Ubiquitin-like domain-containing protein n=1 Tax=Monilinia fructigena TaxID=38457 RepID=A0A395IN35_9HELO|nr:hypothetical protein DID88_010074 [Monilinia fructigena]